MRNCKSANTSLQWPLSGVRQSASRPNRTLASLSQVSWRKVLHWNISQSHRHPTVGNTGGGLRIQDDKAAPGSLDHCAIELHHAVTRLNIACSPQGTSGMDLCDHRGAQNRLDGNLFGRREGSLPCDAKFSYVSGAAYAFCPASHGSQPPACPARQGRKPWLTSNPRKDMKKRLDGVLGKL